MTVRSELDEYCLGKTIAAGAHFRRIVRRATNCALGGCGAVDHTMARPIAPDFWSAPMGQRPGTATVRGGSWFSQGFALEVKQRCPQGESI